MAQAPLLPMNPPPGGTPPAPTSTKKPTLWSGPPRQRPGKGAPLEERELYVLSLDPRRVPHGKAGTLMQLQKQILRDREQRALLEPLTSPASQAARFGAAAQAGRRARAQASGMSIGRPSVPGGSVY